MSNLIKYIPAKSVMSDVYTLLSSCDINERTLEEWIVKGYGLITSHKSYEPAICVKTVENYRCSLPDKLDILDFVMYKNQPKEIEIQMVTTNTWKCEDCTDNDFVLVKAPFYEFINTEGVLNNWKMLRLSGTPLDFKICDDSPCIGCQCSDAFRFDHENNQIVTTFKEGKILIAYKRLPVDENDDLLIPKNEKIIDALETYVLMRFWKKKNLMGDNTAYRNYISELREWELKAAKAKIDSFMPTEHDYIKIASNNRFFQQDSPYRVFSSLGMEHVNFR